MIFKRTIAREDFYYNFYRSINYILNLSKTELAILSHFATSMANLSKSLDASQISAMAFSSANRKIIAETLGISIYNLNNYIKSLKTKGIFVDRPTEDGVRGLMIYPKLWIDSNNLEEYSNEIKFIIK